MKSKDGSSRDSQTLLASLGGFTEAWIMSRSRSWKLLGESPGAKEMVDGAGRARGNVEGLERSAGRRTENRKSSAMVGTSTRQVVEWKRQKRVRSGRADKNCFEIWSSTGDSTRTGSLHMERP